MSISELALLVNDNFDKPLNRQIQDMIGLLADTSKIYTTIGLGKKSERLELPNIAYGSADLSQYLSVVSPNTLNVNCDGTVYFSTSVNIDFYGNPNNDSSAQCIVILYKNNEQILRQQKVVSVPKKGYPTASIDISNQLMTIQKGDVISIKIYMAVYDYVYTPYFLSANFGTAQIKAIPAIIGTNLITKG